MTPVHAIMVLIIRLWAATLIVSSILTLSYYLPFDKSGVENGSVYYAIISAAHAGTWLAMGILGWVLARWLAKRVYPKKDADSVSFVVGAETFVMIGSFLIGIFYLVQYLPQLFTEAAAIFVEIAGEDTSDPYALGKLRISPFTMRDFVGDLLIVLAAFWMAFRPAHIAYMFSKLRRAGLAKVNEGPPEK